MMVMPVPAMLIPAIWDDIKEWFARACLRSGSALSPLDLAERLVTRADHMLVVFPGGAAIFCREGDTLHLASLGGEGVLAVLPELIPVWRNIALLLGCRSLSLRGRRGWNRCLAIYGFTPDGDYLKAEA